MESAMCGNSRWMGWVVSSAVLALSACNLFSKHKEDDDRPLPAPVSAPIPTTVAPQGAATADPLAAPAQPAVRAPTAAQPRPATGTTPAPTGTTTAAPTGTTAATGTATTTATATASAPPAASTAAPTFKLPSQDCLNKCQAELQKCIADTKPGTIPDCNPAWQNCQKACQ